ELTLGILKHLNLEIFNDELEDAKSEDDTLVLHLEDITVRIFFFILDIDYQVIYTYAFTIFGLVLHYTYRRCREKKFMDNQSMQ
ncbi:8380_t:CDS:2, partial [Gigaspora margarita]